MSIKSRSRCSCLTWLIHFKSGHNDSTHEKVRICLFENLIPPLSSSWQDVFFSLQFMMVAEIIVIQPVQPNAVVLPLAEQPSCQHLPPEKRRQQLKFKTVQYAKLLINTIFYRYFQEWPHGYQCQYFQDCPNWYRYFKLFISKYKFILMVDMANKQVALSKLSILFFASQKFRYIDNQKDLFPNSGWLHTPVWQGLQEQLQVEDWHKLAQSQTLSQGRPPNCSVTC